MVEVCRGGTFKVKIDNTDKIVDAYPGGKIRKFTIHIVVGDTVKVEVSPYDLTKGRIVYRKK